MKKCDCDDPTQCWEPCGKLGTTEEDAKRSYPFSLVVGKVGERSNGVVYTRESIESALARQAVQPIFPERIVDDILSNEIALEDVSSHRIGEAQLYMQGTEVRASIKQLDDPRIYHLCLKEKLYLVYFGIADMNDNEVVDLSIIGLHITETPAWG